jgi:hypothetical protein
MWTNVFENGELEKHILAQEGRSIRRVVKNNCVIWSFTVCTPDQIL